MVLPVVVASETETRGGRNEGWKWLVCTALQLSWLLLPRRSHAGGHCEVAWDEVKLKVMRERCLVVSGS